MSYFSCNMFSRFHNSFSAEFCKTLFLHIVLQTATFTYVSANHDNFTRFSQNKPAVPMADQWVTKDKLVEKHYNWKIKHF